MNVNKKPRIKTWTRLWQRRGFGVHSPYAYRLITEVLRETAQFYAYDDLQAVLNNASKGNYDYKVKKKRARLLFRIVNRYQPREILEIGASGGVTTLYMKRACPHAHVVIADTRPDPLADTRNWLAEQHCDAQLLQVQSWHEAITAYLQRCEQPFILVNRMPQQLYAHLAHALRDALHPHAVVMLLGIEYKTPRNVWRQLVADNRVRIAIDMKHSGLIVCNPKLNKQIYYI